MCSFLLGVLVEKIILGQTELHHGYMSVEKMYGWENAFRETMVLYEKVRSGREVCEDSSGRTV